MRGAVVILGIDPGLAHTGWGIVETRGALCRARAYGCVTTYAKEDIDLRLGRIFRELTSVIQRYEPSDVAVEKIFFGQNTRSAIATAQARGAALAACSVAGCSVGEYAPAEIKESVTGNGNADKSQMIFMTRRLLVLDHDPKPDHAADALAAAICHAHLCATSKLVKELSQAARSGGTGGALVGRGGKAQESQGAMRASA